jgi:uncharacterized membrane protein HdeD (DUF308 family)
LEHQSPAEKETPKQEDNLTEFENEKPKKKKQNAGLQVLLGIFFIGYGIYRLTNTIRGDGDWNTFFGWAMIALGIIRIAALGFKK